MEHFLNYKVIRCTNASDSDVDDDGGGSGVDIAAALDISPFLLYALSVGFSNRLMSLPPYSLWAEDLA